MLVSLMMCSCRWPHFHLSTSQSRGSRTQARSVWNMFSGLLCTRTPSTLCHTMHSTSHPRVSNRNIQTQQEKLTSNEKPVSFLEPHFLSVNIRPHFYLWADDHTFVWRRCPYFCLSANDFCLCLSFVYEKMTTFQLCMITMLSGCRWPHICLWVDNHTFV